MNTNGYISYVEKLDDALALAKRSHYDGGSIDTTVDRSLTRVRYLWIIESHVTDSHCGFSLVANFEREDYCKVSMSFFLILNQNLCNDKNY